MYMFVSRERGRVVYIIARNARDSPAGNFGDTIASFDKFPSPQHEVLPLCYAVACHAVFSFSCIGLFSFSRSLCRYTGREGILQPLNISVNSSSPN